MWWLPGGLRTHSAAIANGAVPTSSRSPLPTSWSEFGVPALGEGSPCAGGRQQGPTCPRPPFPSHNPHLHSERHPGHRARKRTPREPLLSCGDRPSLSLGLCWELGEEGGQIKGGPTFTGGQGD